MYKGKAIYWKGKNELIKGDINISDINDGQALIEVKYCGICGSDLAIFKASHPRAKSPLVMGHEISGVIKKVKSNSYKEGDKVVVNPLISCGNCDPCKKGYPYICQNLKLIGIDINGGFAEYVVVNVDKIYKIPEDLDLKTASLVEPFATGAHVLRIANPEKEDLVVILGGGPIGVAAGLFFKYNGVKNIYLSEVSEYRIKVLEKFGFKVINPLKENLKERVKEISNGKLADIVIEATGANGPVFNMVSLAKVSGFIILVGICHKHPVIDLMNVVFKELSLKGIRVYSNEDFLNSLNFVYEHKDILKDYISAEYTLDRLGDALSATGDSNESTKIVIKI